MPARNGTDYLKGLQDDREVWLDDLRVTDVTTHPTLRRGAETIAALYDLQQAPDLHDIMTYPSPTTSDPVGRSFQPPKSIDDLADRRRMMKIWADATCGMMGRTPDFLNVTMMVFAMRHDFLPKVVSNMQTI